VNSKHLADALSLIRPTDSYYSKQDPSALTRLGMTSAKASGVNIIFEMAKQNVQDRGAQSPGNAAY